VGGRHADVEDHDVRDRSADDFDARVGVTCFADDVEATNSEKLGESGSQQGVVLDDYDPHGTLASMRVPFPDTLVTASVPFAAATRS